MQSSSCTFIIFPTGQVRFFCDGRSFFAPVESLAILLPGCLCPWMSCTRFKSLWLLSNSDQGTLSLSFLLWLGLVLTVW